jgi:hypothetical protein
VVVSGADLTTVTAVRFLLMAEVPGKTDGFVEITGDTFGEEEFIFCVDRDEVGTINLSRLRA